MSSAQGMHEQQRITSNAVQITRAVIATLVYGCISSCTVVSEAATCVNLGKLENESYTHYPRVFSPKWKKASAIYTAASNLPDLSNLSVYWWGDSTLRQVAHMVLDQTDATQWTGSEFKAYSRSCPKQHSSRATYVPPPGEDQAPCWQNEHICKDLPLNGTKMGKQLKMSWDWKHLLYEDYDRWRLNSWISGHDDPPDILIMGPGLHDCYHHPNDIKHHVQQLERFLAHVSLLPATVQVVMLDVVPFSDRGALPCTEEINKAMRASAHLNASDSSSRTWLFRRSAVIRGSQKKLHIHADDSVIRSIARFVLLQLHCVVATLREQRQLAAAFSQAADRSQTRLERLGLIVGAANETDTV